MAAPSTEASRVRLAALLSDVVAVAVELAMTSTAGVGLTLPQFRALAIVEAHAPLRLTALAAELGVAPSSATQICDRLTAADLLARTRDPEDQRVVQLMLTEEGQAAIAAVRAERATQMDRVLDGVPARSRRKLLDALTDLSDALGRPSGTHSMFGW